MKWSDRLRVRSRWMYHRVRTVLPKRMVVALSTITALQLTGTVGYPLIEGEPWTLFDGFYMTAITLATIGYGELHPLSDGGRLFTVVLSYSGIFTLAYFASEIVRAVVTGELRDLIGRQRMEDELASLSDHLIVCGYGRMGKIVCDELERQKQKFVVIDTGPVPPDWGYNCGLRIQGNGTEDEVLRRAGIERAKALVTVVGSDADNLYIVLSARLLNPKLMLVARAEEEEAEVKLRKVGANKVISPYLAGGHRAVEAVLRPGVLRFLEMANRPEFADLQIEELKLEPGSELAGAPLRQCRLHQKLGVVVVAILQPDGQVVYAPGGDVTLQAGATIIVIGQRKQLDMVENLVATTRS